MNPAVRLGVSVSFLATALGIHAQAAFYGGDADGVGAIGSERNGALFTDYRVHDDFTLATPTSVTGLLGTACCPEGRSLVWPTRSARAWEGAMAEASSTPARRPA